MTLPLYHQDLCELFERADCPAIFSRKSKSQITLANYLPNAQNSAESIKAIKAVMEAILYLRMNLIMPCQLRFEYIVLQKNKWGICHAICDRSEEISKQNDDSYNPEEYTFHLDSENQLVWHIGKVWLRFFTDTPVKIKHNTQKKVDKLIDSCVENKQINTLLKKLLCLDKTQRIKFEDLLEEQVIGQKEQQMTKFYSSLMVHLRNMSGMMNSKGGMTKFQQKNPFIREINYRRFMEYLDIDMFLQNVKRDIFKEYNNEDEKQKFNCEFTGYIIQLQNYKNMATLNTERLEIGDRFEQITDRIYYAKFTKRMLILKETVERKGNKLKQSPYMRKNLLRFVDEPDSIDNEVVYIQFKTCLSEYAEYLKEDLQQNKKDMIALKLLAKIIIARTSGYIFNQYRNQVFEPLLKGQKKFNIKKIYSKINECSESEPLRNLYSKIQQFYFKN